MYKYLFTLIIFKLSIGFSFAQFAPQIGFQGCDAISSDSSILVSWAKSCTLKKGFQQINDTTLGLVTVGNDSSALGKPDNMVVSLGDKGEAILSFEKPIYNGAGADFAVFENGFLNNSNKSLAYLELAFVEVSTDGIHFVRFPAQSLTPTNNQIGAFAYINASQINNLAGKYIGGYGTPFDLEQIKDSANIDVNNINYVKIIDVVGSIDSKFASYDSKGNIINDPFPTPFPSSGFDLDAVGVIHEKQEAGIENNENNFSFYPNPCENNSNINFNKTIKKAQIINQLGKEIINAEDVNLLAIENLVTGIYYLKIELNNQISTQKLIIR